MFISNTEKATIQKNLKDMASVIADALVDITVLKAKIKVLESKKKTEEVVTKPKKNIADEDRRAKQRAYARKYYAKKKLADKQKEKANVSS